MKATGVVRRIDDLGRIVLPKELRRTMRIKEGESLEIYTDGDNKTLTSYLIKRQNIINNAIAPIYGINISKYHQPLRPVSCNLRIHTAKLGINKIKDRIEYKTIISSGDSTIIPKKTINMANR